MVNPKRIVINAVGEKEMDPLKAHDKVKTWLSLVKSQNGDINYLHYANKMSPEASRQIIKLIFDLMEGRNLAKGSPKGARQMTTISSYLNRLPLTIERIEVPAQYTDNNRKVGRTCKITYSLSSQSSQIKTTVGAVSNSGSKVASFAIFSPANVVASVKITAKIKYVTYTWQYSNKRWRCTQSSTDYTTETIIPSDSISLRVWQTVPPVTAVIGSPYLQTQQIELNETERNYELSTDNATLR
jgi:hypothetical protein